MAIIYQHDKRSGITYAYESHSFWDKEKQSPRAKRTLIGRVDKVSGAIIPTDGRCRKNKVKTKDNINYKTLYEKLEKKLLAQNILIESLQKEIARLKAKRNK